MSESDYQQELINNILNQGSATELPLPGMSIYRNNWLENAHRALAVGFPTVQMLLGEDNFRTLARFACERLHKTEYDWGEWGLPDSFVELVAEFLQMQNAPQLSYVIDVARLDATVFAVQRASDPVVNQASLAVLSSEQAAQASLHVAESTRYFTSQFPIVDLYVFAHTCEGDLPQIQSEINDVFERNSETSGPLHYIHVSRREFKPIVEAVSEADYRMLELAAAGGNIEALFEQAHGLNLDFATWLGESIAQLKVIGAE